MAVSVKGRHCFLAALPPVLLAMPWPRVAAAQSTVVIINVGDSTGAPVLPSRIDVLGTSIFALGDTSGRVVLPESQLGTGRFKCVASVSRSGRLRWLCWATPSGYRPSCYARIPGLVRSASSCFRIARAWCGKLAPNKRLKLTGGDRFKGSGVLCPWRARTSSNILAPVRWSPAA